MPRRVLFLGADACDPGLVMQWAEAGQLPYFGELVKTGLRVRTQGPAGIYGGALWPTFVTGVSPGRHGSYAFTQYSPRTYLDERRLPDHQAEEPFWLRLDRAGRRVGLIDVPLAPLRPVVNGFQIVEWGSHDIAAPRMLVSSPAVGLEVERVVGRALVRHCEGHRLMPGEFRRLRDTLVEQVRRRTRLGAHFLGQGPWDFFACVFGESHCAGHQLWRHHDPSHPDHDQARARGLGGDPLLDVYRAIDRGLATLAGHADEDTVVVVWCSHGMGPHYDATFLLDTILRRFEDPDRLLRPLAGPGPVRRLVRRIPLHWRRPISRAVSDFLQPAAARRVAAERRSRRVFAVPDNEEQGAVRVNLIGRDVHGRVQPGAEYEALLARLREALLELENVETGQPVVTGFQYPQALNAGPYVPDLPDMTVEWNRSRPIRAIRSPRLGLIEGVSPNARSGDHTREGLLFVLHRSVASGELERVVDVVDLAPTLTGLLGVSLDGFDGRPIPEVLAV